MSEVITSVQNARVKNLVRLRDGGHRRRQERFLIEGCRELQRALQCGWPLETLFFCEEHFTDREASFGVLHAAEEAGVEIVQMANDPFLKAAYRQGPDGLLGVGMERPRPLRELVLGKSPLLVVLESLEKPGNLGAIFRTANAAGADALIVTEAVADPYNPSTIRSSQGAFFQLPFALCKNAEARQFLEEKGIRAVPTSPDGPATLWETDLRGPTALVFGAEAIGLSEIWLKNAIACRLPMKGVTDSLNVSSMAAVALFEAVRQRSA